MVGDRRIAWTPPTQNIIRVVPYKIYSSLIAHARLAGRSIYALVHYPPGHKYIFEHRWRPAVPIDFSNSGELAIWDIA